MAQYRYRGRDRRGRKVSGRMQGEAERDVRMQLKEDGIQVTELRPLNSILYKEINIGSGVKNKEFVIFLRQFATMLGAGISVVDATSILAGQSKNKVFRRVLQDVEEDLRAGRPYSEAADQHRRVFPPLFVNMMKAGEAGGNLDEILERLASYYERQNETRQKVVSALSYPIVIGLVAFFVVLFLLSFVVPTFIDMFEQYGSELPWITRFVMAAGEAAGSFWWLILLGLIGVVVAYIQLRKRSRQARYYIDYTLLRLPLFGQLLRKAALARMTRTLSSLFASSVPVLQSVSIVERVVGNEVISRVLQAARTSLERGERMSAPMDQHWAFPPMVAQMVAVGEQTGNLDEMLDKVADFYEAEVESATDQMKSLIEPLMILVLAGVVGVIVAAIAIPMFEVFGEVQ
ncbi:type IV pilus assembly protein PilC [Salsuginibacillus halophilus]|uniref:Type IV pilus assembly protein PilC n=1 Tax=Salsuginibacillus halophilus TaxID=517424 RepID=A0A2P8HCM4_9BACI|nr:type II secretion system F family protein [Salsuginibacillus halophilus]PSL43980.1 type IV pilus assembly protein PilC [Salsuginibacillus halophilus]